MKYLILSVLIFTCYGTLSCKKHHNNNTTASSLLDSDSKDPDQSFMFLYEEPLHDPKLSNKEKLSQAVVYRVHCGGMDRLLTRSAASLIENCKILASAQLNTFLFKAYSDLTEVPNSNLAVRNDFMSYLISTIRTPDFLDKTLVIEGMDFGIITLNEESGLFKEIFAPWLNRVSDWLRLTRVDKHLKEVKWDTDFEIQLKQGWNLVELDFDSEIKAQELSILQSQKCYHYFSSIEALAYPAIGHFLNRNISIGPDGEQQRFRARLNQESSFRSLRIIGYSDREQSCKWNIGRYQKAEGDSALQLDSQPTVDAGALAEGFERVAQRFSSTPHRLHHLMWHSVRNTWNRPGIQPRDREALAASLIGQDWTPPRPLIYENGVVNIASTERHSAGAGEDFLYMHRKMLEEARRVFNPEIFPKITNLESVFETREQLIAAGIAQRVPVPSLDVFEQRKNQLRQQERHLDELLRSGPSLSLLGTTLEWTLHNNLHTYFSRPIQEVLISNRANPWLMGNRFFERSFGWNQQNYQHLGDPYASAVNPVFWLIHAYVDLWVDRWVEARADIDEINSDCKGRARCYQWTYKWMGASTSNYKGHQLHGHADHHDHGDGPPPEVKTTSSAQAREFSLGATFGNLEQ